MEIKVRAVESVEKSKAEVEQELLDKAEVNEQQESQTEKDDSNVERLVIGNENTTSTQEQESVQSEDEAQEEITQSSELKEEDVLSFIKNRYNKDVSSVGQLFEEREKNIELPEDVQAYFDYKQKTGRGIEDYVKLNRDFNALEDDQLLSEYLLASGEAIDKEDVELLMDEYSFDEDVDEEKTIKKARLAKKKAIVKARKFFNEQKEMYKEPLESSGNSISDADKTAIQAYNEYIAQAKNQEEELKRRREWFMKKTNELFHADFKGFDFNVGEDKTLTFLPSKSVNDLKELNSDGTKWIQQYLNKETGVVEDTLGYHRAIAIANNPDKFARFFYEQGKSDATENVTRKLKNIKMSEQVTPQVARTKDGMQIRALNPSSGKGLKIRSIKRK